MERQYPPFGSVPGPVFGAYQLRYAGKALVVSLDSFAALDSGLLALLRLVTTKPELFDATFGFERMTPTDDTQLELSAWLDTATATKVDAHLASGHHGTDRRSPRAPLLAVVSDGTGERHKHSSYRTVLAGNGDRRADDQPASERRPGRGRPRSIAGQLTRRGPEAPITPARRL